MCYWIAYLMLVPALAQLIESGSPHVQRTPEERARKRCGYSARLNSRIVGGRPADKGAWPWMAALLDKEDEQPFCGGALISDQHVLTAAHCILYKVAKDIIVRLGEHDFDVPNADRKDFLVDKIARHEDYETKTYQNDVAILQLKTKVAFTDEIMNICLPPFNFDAEGHQDAFVAGWGTTSYGGPTSQVLREIQLPIWATADCKKTYPKEGLITDNQLCAGFKQGGKDACQGDSGGPLMLQEEDQWVVVGIVSWGDRCSLPDKPGVYTKVEAYADWIRSNLRSNPTAGQTITPGPNPTLTRVELPTGCGARISSRIVRRTVGGRVAGKGAWPWMAALLQGDDKTIICSGSLISNQHILTTARCMDGRLPEDIIVRLGEDDFDEPNTERRDFSVDRIMKHGQFDSTTLQNDIVIMKLKTKVTFTTTIQAICVPPASLVAEGQNAIFAGWGRTSVTSNYSRVLQEVELPIVTLADCKRSFPQYVVTDKNMCAGLRKGGKGACQGDGGGPLMLQLANGRWSVVGVVSWGQDCALPDKPDVFTKVMAYTDWIGNLLQ